MYAVIFTARIGRLDATYHETAKRMRELAQSQYGCRGFTSVREGDVEVTVSYWETKDQIAAWKRNAEHLVAQARGREGWYRTYCVQVVEVLREYADEPGGSTG